MTTVKQVGGVELKRDDGYESYSVAVDGRHVWRTGDLDKARAVANAAHRARRGTTAEQVAAGLVRGAELDRADWPGMSADEALWGAVNVALGMCPDGCCGGVEMFDGPNDPRLPEWESWRDELRAAVRAAA